ncbi:NB-ARC domain, LRR domain containing protein [Trema orientale]|uniref:NB-ARC domain, LRR domain containing protein n=1 Tax=Trema orientale TaxID=63057 RepID=A0A2P5FM63_TREOI|nr:NB-ARC domain, LRR domain containing protein [Trema orientale]
MTVGEAFLSAFLQVLFDRLASHEFIGLLSGKKYDDMLEKLKITLLSVTVLLNDAEEKQFYSPAVEKWLHMAKDAIYDAEDILDELATEALKWKLEAESQATKDHKVWNWNRVSSSLSPSSRGVESKIRKIIERLELIAKYKNVLGLKDNSGERSFDLKHRLETTSLVEESCVHGMGDDKQVILQILLGDEPNGGNIGVIPIVGMGGIGKTTLAQLVFNDRSVDNHFKLKVWACVTDQFDAVRVTKTILNSITSKNFDLDDLNLLQVSLKEHLAGIRFLLVLDDVWNKRNSDWDLLWKPLKAGGRGSKIIITTQNGDVAAGMGTVPAHQLRGLTYEDSWLLFISEAFENKDIDVHPNLKAVGEKIVEKCQGLPLAVKKLGVLLRSRMKEDEWKDILNRKMWDLPDEESDILQTLRLGYHHLPTHLKQCFAFCSVFPTGHEFDKDSLVLLWMAEGFLQQPKGNKRLEEVGHDYFRELVSRSIFVQSTHNRSKFVMHSLLKELADFVSGDFCFQLEDRKHDGNRNRIFEKARHSSYIRGKRDVFSRFKAFSGVDYLRTFLPLDPTGSIGVSYLADRVPDDLLPKLSYLRVLSFNACRITKLPNSIGNLKHLRYLDLSCTAIKELPEPTNTLYNLQTLNLSQCRYLTKLPSKMGNLKCLRHFCISGSSLREMPLQICELRNLQTLSNFVVGQDSGSGIGELRNMIHLQGSLQISGLHNIVNFVDATEANMKEKMELEQLVYQWSNSFDDSFIDRDEEEVPYLPQHPDVSMRGYRSTRFPSFRETMNASRQKLMEAKLEDSKILDVSRDERIEMLVLEMLQPHKGIKKVTIKDYGGTIFPSWIGSTLFSNIKFLKLSNCMKCVYLPALGQLPSLKDLMVEGMERIKSIGIEFYGDGYQSVIPFPSLETLKFESMLNWEDWSSCGVEGGKEFDQLQKIEIRNCPKLRKFSHCFAALKKMSIKGCEELIALPRLSMSHDSITECREFPCLLELSIWACPNLQQLPRSFPSLTMLEIDGCQSLAELPKLPSICDLELENCNVNVLQSIVGLKSLSYLRMCQILKLTCLPDGFFQNLTNLEELHIADHSDLTNLSNKIGLHKLPCLQRMEISGCPLLDELPQSLYKLPSLKELRVWNCPSLVSFPSTGLPSSLTDLEIKDCDALHSLPNWKMHNKKLSISLEYLIIEGCSLLTYLPRDELPNTLKELEIQGCTSLESLPSDVIHVNNSLELLRIAGCHSITCFPAIHQPIVTSSTITNLKQLIVNDCANLKLLPDGLQNLVHLDHLEITDCPLLVSFPESGLPFSRLRSIRLSNCGNLKSLPDRLYSLTSLEGLFIEGCSSISLFPEGGLPVNLISLSILDCEKLKPSFQWGLHRLFHLTDLMFGGCKELVSFPEDWLLPNSLCFLQLQRLPNLKMLPKGLENLSALDNLEIWECDSLQTLFDDEQPKMLENYDFWDVL